MSSPPPRRHLALVGFRAVGKSVVARELAATLGQETVDLDSAIEQRRGQSITEIFDGPGEAFFRELESRMLLQLLDHPSPQIIATGGGTVLAPENREALKTHCRSIVWLRAQPETIRERIETDSQSPETRPPLLGKDSRDEVELVLKARTPLYSAIADYALDTDRQSPTEIVQKIAEHLRQEGRV
ncbi:MAG: shikimate kinase [Planctomycetota bacterium]|nr:shikimate kinase [Planctomycetota bacterium]